MQKLKNANLYRSELIKISGELVDRYNACLEKLALAPTKLKTFFIDGIGWSPEVAEEKKDNNYLNHGDANPHGILISPEQREKPVYIPFHSFDRDMMKFIFKNYGKEINDITRDSAICLAFDQGIDRFYEPLDVLRYADVKISFRLMNDLDKIQEDQQKLIDKFRAGNNFIDEKIHEELLESAKKYGDLRNRVLSLKPLTYKTQSFYTRAFGGVFVLRDFISPILVFQSQETYKLAIKDTLHDVFMFHIDQKELIDKLKDHLIIECDLEKIVDSRRYSRIKKCMFHRVLKEANHPIDKILEDDILFKSYLNRIDAKALNKVNGVEIYLERLERSNAYKIHDLVDEDLYHALHQPHSSLTAEHQDLIWKLLIKITPLDVLFLYWYDKMTFYENYQTWDDAYKDWVISTIRNNI